MSESPESHSASASSSSHPRSATASESPPDSSFANLTFPYTSFGPLLHAQQLPLQHDDSSSNHSAQPPVEKPYHTKRPHKKSRAGCKNCKARKVKCDEARPICRSCRLRKADCQYPDLPPGPTTGASRAEASNLQTNAKRSKPTSSLTTAPTTQHNSPGATLTSTLFTDPVLTSFNPEDDLQIAPTPSAALYDDKTDPTYDATTPLVVVAEPAFNPMPVADQSDLKLLWWYTAETATSFAIGGHQTKLQSAGVNIMRGALVQLAFQQPFLMDSVFALSSLHILNLDPSSPAVDHKRALHLRQRSFLGYRKAIEKADPQTFPALLANSLLLTALASQTFRDPEADDLYIIEWMVVWKGIGLIIDLISVPTLFRCGLQPLFFRPQINLDEAAAAIPNNLLFMISSIPSTDPEYHEKEVYYGTLKHLGALYSGLKDGVNAIIGLSIVTFFTFVPKRFAELSRLRRPRTLVILAHYAVFLKLISSVWWARGIGQRTLDDIAKHIDPEWHHFMRTPLLAQNMSDVTALARLLLENPRWTQPDEDSTEEIERRVRELSWVDNAGRKMILKPGADRMVAKETDDGPDLVPFFDQPDTGNCGYVHGSPDELVPMDMDAEASTYPSTSPASDQSF